MTFDVDFALSTLPFILKGLFTTLWVTVASALGASILGFVFEVLRRTSRVMGLLMRFVIDAIRSTPVLVQLYFLYFVLPFWGVVLPALVVGVIGLSVYYSGYLAEVFKAGIDAIPRGQTEAAKAIGLTRLDVIAFVIAPQMLRNIAAPMGNYFVSILKATPYLAVIAVPEMLGSALDIGSRTFRYAEPMLVVGAIFLVLAVAIGQGVRWLELRLLASTRR
ncbi:ectoine/hydroxyectoine ABC transporter permease subunit EhuD [Pararhodobacter zhoushanensis]|uniref:Ectoine/hydroxyectoine ABC transporter permease subunit EhuD n=1 Tax=Pararhodobacter zhoushanensis TaxID=2479545 RepID=A0ABT3GYX9_9RHOB|nr:ectoine/hydroxyectoine ABC transporter permease subunit EhuD [Pararhodobacter zhoushanensis]MCW1932695.1 ectoine/hydroxyectoine ABC transporter permease subunit EhuD [Pararhodobacter zhoushanensis]